MKLIKVECKDAKTEPASKFDKQFYSIYNGLKRRISSDVDKLWFVVNNLQNSLHEDLRTQKGEYDGGYGSPYQQLEKIIKEKQTLLTHLTFMMKELNSGIEK